MFTSEDYRNLNRKERNEAARRNMRSAMKAAKIKDDELGEVFDHLEDRDLSRKLVNGRWTQGEINEVVDRLPADLKVQMYNPKGFNAKVDKE
ncbi:MAG: hypothetical protein AAF808_06805 [Cyanobacteria bacterium P01_D01_bin.2]